MHGDVLLQFKARQPLFGNAAGHLIRVDFILRREIDEDIVFADAQPLQVTAEGGNRRIHLLIAFRHRRAFLIDAEDGDILIGFDIHQDAGFDEHRRRGRRCLRRCHDALIAFVLLGLALAAGLRISDIAARLPVAGHGAADHHQ